MNRKYYGEFGGQYVPEVFMPALEELEHSFRHYKDSDAFRSEYRRILADFGGRPTPLTFAEHLSHLKRCRIYLKREDLLHTGAHKLNNTVGQALLALKMKKKELIAETGAGQHGVSVATAGAYFNIPVKVFMGAEDVKRQALNVFKMKLLGAEVVPVKKGQRTLKDAINEAFRYWSSHVKTSYYLLGSVMGPYPYPEIVKYFQSIIGQEVQSQILKAEQRLPDYIVACVGGGSNAMGIFNTFIPNKKIRLIACEAGGRQLRPQLHSATLNKGRLGVLHGMKTLLLTDRFGQIEKVHSIAPGLDYPGVGPELSFLARTKRIEPVSINDDEAVKAFKVLSRKTGIIPALESAHAVAWVLKSRFKPGNIAVINISGRGDKDLNTVHGL
ncbi:MAG: tryptophan synthase subunit beta [bacterium]|nr:tryptophan synthase subunit beta [bacterium]